MFLHMQINQAYDSHSDSWETQKNRFIICSSTLSFRLRKYTKYILDKRITEWAFKWSRSSSCGFERQPLYFYFSPILNRCEITSCSNLLGVMICWLVYLKLDVGLVQDFDLPLLLSLSLLWSSSISLRFFLSLSRVEALRLALVQASLFSVTQLMRSSFPCAASSSYQTFSCRFSSSTSLSSVTKASCLLVHLLSHAAFISVKSLL